MPEVTGEMTWSEVIEGLMDVQIFINKVLSGNTVGISGDDLRRLQRITANAQLRMTKVHNDIGMLLFMMSCDRPNEAQTILDRYQILKVTADEIISQNEGE